jgi:vacuolar-type H+-ATPase subunit E/Vma4
MIRLLEENVEVKVRKGEQDMIQKMFAGCEKEFKEHMKKETGRDYETKLTIMAERFLTVEEGSEFGGVILFAHGRRIVVPNTLKDRMSLVFELSLPYIRKELFEDNK